MINEIEVQTENGTAFGYVIDKTEPNIKNYLDEHTEHASAIFRLLSTRFNSIALLRNMYVEEDCRGQGEGSDLVSQFLEEAYLDGADIVMLISDAGEDQADGFDLVTFYEGLDMFSSIETSSGMLMFDCEETAQSVKRLVKKMEINLSPSP